MNDNISEEHLNEIAEMIASHNKIGAIKRYRALMGVDLAQAKHEIEKIEKSLHQEFPERFASKPKAKGCLGSIAVLCVVGVTVCYWLFGT
jgi:ribosomal protein L7/L12